jgi:hypothetical protein
VSGFERMVLCVVCWIDRWRKEPGGIEIMKKAENDAPPHCYLFFLCLVLLSLRGLYVGLLCFY